MDHDPDSQAFLAVAEPRRRAILEHLAQGDRSVTEIIQHLGTDQPTVSKALRVLREADLVTSIKQGRLRIYRINTPRIRAMNQWTRIFEPFWNQQILQIKHAAEQPSRRLGVDESAT